MSIRGFNIKDLPAENIPGYRLTDSTLIKALSDEVIPFLEEKGLNDYLPFPHVRMRFYALEDTIIVTVWDAMDELTKENIENDNKIGVFYIKGYPVLFNKSNQLFNMFLSPTDESIALPVRSKDKKRIYTFENTWWVYASIPGSPFRLVYFQK